MIRAAAVPLCRRRGAARIFGAEEKQSTLDESPIRPQGLTRDLYRRIQEPVPATRQSRNILRLTPFHLRNETIGLEWRRYAQDNESKTQAGKCSENARQVAGQTHDKSRGPQHAEAHGEERQARRAEAQTHADPEDHQPVRLNPAVQLVR